MVDRQEERFNLRFWLTLVVRSDRGFRLGDIKSQQNYYSPSESHSPKGNPLDGPFLPISLYKTKQPLVDQELEG